MKRFVIAASTLGFLAVALATGAAPACAQDAASTDAARAKAAAPADAAPPSIAPLELHAASPRGDDAAVDFKPTGSIFQTSQVRPREAAGLPETTRLDFLPPAAQARELLLRAPLPPEAPPLSSNAAIVPNESPAVAIPVGASSLPEPVAPPPALAPKPVDFPAAPANPAPAFAPNAVAAPEAPPSSSTTSDFTLDLDAALTVSTTRRPTANPLGAGDWLAARAAVGAFYADRLFAPVWVDASGLTPAGRSVVARLARAAEDGLDLAAFALPDPSFADPRPEIRAQVEVTISQAVVAYALQASGARIVPSSLSRLVTARPAVADPAKALLATASAAEPGDALAAYNPPQKGYLDLREELAELRASSPVASPRVPNGPTLRIGMADSRVPLIRARFGLRGPVGGADPDAARVYDIRVAIAVAAFQKSNGLAADGALTNATSEALFGNPHARRESAILANMEMWRWQPRDMGQMRIEINVPDFMLHFMDGADEIHRARVIVGKPDTQTPIFSNEVKYILVNPIWRVPDSIIKKEMAPKLADDPDYLTKRGFKVSYVGDRIVVEQPPGEANALGHILFMFPNEHAVYLHDTPSRALFATSRRAYSHGCIRVEQPMRLAELLMGGGARGWSAEKFESMLGTNERWIFLPRPLPIHIEYFTEFVDEAGTPQQREDVYGLTAQVAATLSRLRQD